MSPTLRITIRFLDSRFHGRGDGGAPEWPPSPLRLFQALVATAAARSGGAPQESAEFSALRWLESLPPPVIVAPTGHLADPYRLSVPNNAMDIVGRAWARGNLDGKGDADPRTHRTMKTVQPTLVPELAAVQYEWKLASSPMNEILGHLERLPSLVRNLVTVGWGFDFVAANAVVSSESEPPADNNGVERWIPSHGEGTILRVPTAGTLDALVNRHSAFLQRCTEGFVPVAPLSPDAFAASVYRSCDAPVRRPFAAFVLLQPDASGMRAFDARKGRRVAGMLRHATAAAARDARKPDEFIARFVQGHGESEGQAPSPVGPQRFAFLPIPTIEARKGAGRVVGAIRRAVITSFADGCDAEIDWARRMLGGRDLINEDDGDPAAILSLLPADEKMILNFVRPASVWMSVSPVILPGYDDPRHYRRRLDKGDGGADEQRQLLARLSLRIDGLLRKAIRQAGIPSTLADHAEIEWRTTGFCAGVERVDRYFTPNHLRRFSHYHVRIAWKNSAGKSVEIPGPICLGGGRYQGLGLFTAAD